MERKVKTAKRALNAIPLPIKRRRTYKGRNRNYVTVNSAPRIRVPRGLNPLPSTLITNLAYHANYTTGAGAAAGATTVRVFNANSLYDPDTSGVGHQPLGFDQLMPMYDHYVVLGSKISVRAAPGNSTYANTLVGVSGNAIITPRSAHEYQEAGYNTWDIMSTYTSIPTSKLIQGFSPKKHLGIPDPLTSDKLQGSAGTNPTDGWFWHIFVAPTNQAISHISVTLEVTINYHVAFIEPRQLAPS